MKVFISADIEGVTGVTHWDETEKNKTDHATFAEQMTLEVRSACEGANDAGADEILVKDAHDSGRNLNHSRLPKNTKLIRGWSGGIYSMVQGLDESFDALIYIGYHSAAGTSGNPLSHTMNTSLEYVKLNGEYVNEFLIHSYIAAYLNVPVVFLSGDKALCDEVAKVDSNIYTVAVKEGVGDSTINIHPELARDLICDRVKESLSGDLSRYHIELPETFKLEIGYREHFTALKYSNFPGVERSGPKSIVFTHSDYIEVVKAIKFLT